jgi:cell division protein FtsQ
MSKKTAHIAGIKNRLKAFFSRPVKLSLLVFALILLIASIGKHHDNREIREVEISLLNENDNFFLDETEVFNLMTLDGSEWVAGQKIEGLDLKKLENRLNRNVYLEKSEVFVDLKGNVNVNVWLKQPIARLIPDIGSQSYLCKDRSIIPLNDKYASRVMLIRGEGVKYLNHKDSLQTEFGTRFLSFLETIGSSAFLKAQVSEIEILKNQELIIYPQVTRQYIEFGDLVAYEDKLEKLDLFYNKILPYKGWNTYERVSLKFKNQIVCE